MSGDPKPLGPSYEQSAVRVAAVVLFTVVTAVATGALMAAMVWLYGRYESRELEAARGMPPITRIERPAQLGPPDPVIQGAPGSRFELEDPAAEMKQQMERMERTLNGSDRTPQATGRVRIPIEHAKKLLLERGLPVRAAAAENTGGEP